MNFEVLAILISLIGLLFSLVVVVRVSRYVHSVLKQEVDRVSIERDRWDNLAQEIIINYLPKESAEVSTDYLEGKITLEELRERLPRHHTTEYTEEKTRPLLRAVRDVVEKEA